MDEKKFLVVYFSQGGHTAKIAKRVAKRMNCSIFEIVPEKKYSGFFPTCVKQAVKEKKENARPEFIGDVEDLDQYTDIVLGYPCWCGTCPMIVLSFIEKHDFSGKTLHLFNTHKGSGSKGTEAIISCINDGTVMKSVPHEELKKDEDIARWLIV